MPIDVRPPIANVFKREGARAAIRPLLALVAVALAAWPALAGSDYPPGLFENSPVVGQPGAAAPPGPDAGSADSLPPESPGPLEDYCASVAGRTFRSREEVRQAHARCDPDRGAGHALTPDDQPDQ